MWLMFAGSWIGEVSVVPRDSEEGAVIGDVPSRLARAAGFDTRHRLTARRTFPRPKEVSVAALVVAAIPLAAGIDGLAGPSRVFAFCLAYVMALGVVASRRRVRVPAPILFLVGFGLGAAISATVSSDPLMSLIRAVAFLGLLVCAFLVAEKAEPLYLASTAFVVIPASLSVLSLALAVVSPARVFAAGEGFQRLFLPVFSLHPNTLGAVAAIGIVVAIGRATAPAARRWVWFAVITVELLALLLTYSRSSLLDIVVGLLVFAYVVRRAMPLIFVVGGVAAVVIATVGDTLLSLLLRTQGVEAIGGLSGRRDIWEVALEAWSSNPLRGIGYGEGAATVLESSGLYLSYSVSTTDNFLIDALLETGPIGAIMVLGLYVAAFREIRRARIIQAADSATRRLSAEFAAVVAMILVHALGSGGVGRFHVLAVLLVYALVGLWRGNRSCVVGAPARTHGVPGDRSDTTGMARRSVAHRGRAR